MKVVILAGGKGTRLQEETAVKPKPMVEIGGRPMLWHIMKMYEVFGYGEFVVALGYKGQVIKDYFLNYRQLNSDFTVDLATGQVQVHEQEAEHWRVHLLDTGLATQTGGRVKRVASYLGNEAFMLTYGDGVANIDIQKLLEFHRSHGKLATVTGVRPPARFGGITCEGNLVCRFEEKPQTPEGWINGGFFVFEPRITDYIEGDDTVLERRPLEQLAKEQQLVVYRHTGFWQCMDTLRDVQFLQGLWSSGEAPWKMWSRA